MQEAAAATAIARESIEVLVDACANGCLDEDFCPACVDKKRAAWAGQKAAAARKVAALQVGRPFCQLSTPRR